MMKQRRLWFTALTLFIFSILLAGPYSSAAPPTKLAKPIHIQAQAMGTSTQMGRSYSITATTIH